MFDTWLALVCHQRADRLLLFGGSPLPVCSRCAGLYLALATAAVILGVVHARGGGVNVGPRLRLLGALLLVPAMLHPLFPVTFVGTPNESRFVVGALTGLLLAVIVPPAIVPAGCSLDERASHFSETVMLIVGVTLIGLTVLYDIPGVASVVRTLVVCGALVYAVVAARLAVIVSRLVVDGRA